MLSLAAAAVDVGDEIANGAAPALDAKAPTHKAKPAATRPFFIFILISLLVRRALDNADRKLPFQTPMKPQSNLADVAQFLLTKT